jgi:hypothetical protein
MSNSKTVDSERTWAIIVFTGVLALLLSMGVIMEASYIAREGDINSWAYVQDVEITVAGKNKVWQWNSTKFPRVQQEHYLQIESNDRELKGNYVVDQRTYEEAAAGDRLDPATVIYISDNKSTVIFDSSNSMTKEQLFNVRQFNHIWELIMFAVLGVIFVLMCTANVAILVGEHKEKGIEA